MLLRLLLVNVLPVEEDQYWQCEQSKLCFRNREVGRSYWTILHKSLEFHEDYFQAIIIDDIYDKQLSLNAWILQTSSQTLPSIRFIARADNPSPEGIKQHAQTITRSKSVACISPIL
jgi:hypothetical protein